MFHPGLKHPRCSSSIPNLSFVSQGHHWIQVHRPPRGNVARQYDDAAHQDRDEYKNPTAGNVKTREEAAEGSWKRKRARRAPPPPRSAPFQRKSLVSFLSTHFRWFLWSSDPACSSRL